MGKTYVAETKIYRLPLLTLHRMEKYRSAPGTG